MEKMELLKRIQDGFECGELKQINEIVYCTYEAATGTTTEVLFYDPKVIITESFRVINKNNFSLIDNSILLEKNDVKSIQTIKSIEMDNDNYSQGRIEYKSEIPKIFFVNGIELENKSKCNFSHYLYPNIKNIIEKLTMYYLNNTIKINSIINNEELIELLNMQKELIQKASFSTKRTLELSRKIFDLNNKTINILESITRENEISTLKQYKLK